MTIQNSSKLSQFLNSIWLMSSVKEWILRIIFFTNLPLIISLCFALNKEGVTQESIKGNLIVTGVSIVISVCFIGFLYRKFSRGQLSEKTSLFKD